MRKIIGFKLPLRLKEIQRRAKKAAFSLEAAGLGEPELQALLNDAARAVKPGVIFETFSHPDPDLPALSPMPGLAFSLVLATLGPGYDAFEQAKNRTDWAGFWPVLRETALDEAVRFAAGLLNDEAVLESCELSPITTLSEPSALETALRKLDGSKIGIAFNDGRLTPAASCAASLSWIAKSKAKKSK